MRKAIPEFKHIQSLNSVYIPISKIGSMIDQCGIEQDIIKTQCRKCTKFTNLDIGELKRRENFIFCDHCPEKNKREKPTGFTWGRNKNGFIDRSIRIPNK